MTTRERLTEATKNPIRTLMDIAPVIWKAKVGDYWCGVQGTREVTNDLRNALDSDLSVDRDWPEDPDPNATLELKFKVYCNKWHKSELPPDDWNWLMMEILDMFMINDVSSMLDVIFGPGTYEFSHSPARERTWSPEFIITAKISL